MRVPALTPALSQREREWGQMPALIPAVTAYAMRAIPLRLRASGGVYSRDRGVAWDMGGHAVGAVKLLNLHTLYINPIYPLFTIDKY